MLRRQLYPGSPKKAGVARRRQPGESGRTVTEVNQRRCVPVTPLRGPDAPRAQRDTVSEISKSPTRAPPAPSSGSSLGLIRTQRGKASRRRPKSTLPAAVSSHPARHQTDVSNGYDCRSVFSEVHGLLRYRGYTGSPRSRASSTRMLPERCSLLRWSAEGSDRRRFQAFCPGQARITRRSFAGRSARVRGARADVNCSFREPR